MMEDDGLQPQNINDPGIATWLATDMGMQVLVLGRLDNDTERLNISVTSYNVKNGTGISLFKVTVPLTDKIKGLIPDALVGESHDNPAAPNGKCVSSGSLPCGPTPGYSAPKCIRCPPADYSQEAKDQRAQGTVVLLVVVDENGKAENIIVVRALPYGLTRQAIQAVQKWKFQPATGPNGEPAAVRQLLEVTFHLY
jgi:TonB family protein